MKGNIYDKYVFKNRDIMIYFLDVSNLACYKNYLFVLPNLFPQFIKLYFFVFENNKRFFDVNFCNRSWEK